MQKRLTLFIETSTCTGVVYNMPTTETTL